MVIDPVTASLNNCKPPAAVPVISELIEMALGPNELIMDRLVLPVEVSVPPEKLIVLELSISIVLTGVTPLRVTVTIGEVGKALKEAVSPALGTPSDQFPAVLQDPSPATC